MGVFGVSPGPAGCFPSLGTGPGAGQDLSFCPLLSVLCFQGIPLGGLGYGNKGFGEKGLGGGEPQGGDAGMGWRHHGLPQQSSVTMLGVPHVLGPLYPGLWHCAVVGCANGRGLFTVLGGTIGVTLLGVTMPWDMYCEMCATCTAPCPAVPRHMCCAGPGCATLSQTCAGLRVSM